ncbi:hypothetical protein BGZ47_010919 [Haplosporangium gracile]|nr:hypothetical protein BGZ47_010919 [Haplosporangium gracile]
MAHSRPHESSSQPAPAIVLLPTDRSPAFIQSLMRAASESTSSHGGAPTTAQLDESTQSYQPPTSATIVSSVTTAAAPAPRRSSNASLTEAPPRIKENNQPLPHLPVIRLVDQETPSITSVQGEEGAAAVVSGGIIGPYDNAFNSSGHSNNPPRLPRIPAPSSSLSSSSSSLSDKPLPPKPIVETSSSSSFPSSASSGITNHNNNSPASTLPYPQQHQHQQHIVGASPLVSTAISFAQGEQYLGANIDNNSGNANNNTAGVDNGPRQSLDHAPPPYSFMPGNCGSTIISTGPPPPTEDQLFQIQELSPGPLAVSSSSSFSYSGTGSSTLSAIAAHHQSTQYICADPMHDQQYLLVGSGNALHSIDLTFSNHQQQQQQQERQQGGVSSNNNAASGGVSSLGNVVRTHIQGVAFKEIHCLEEIGLVIVIAGRNSRVRCYDYDSINRLIAYGHSAQGRGRVVEGGKLGAVKNMIQLRVETVLQRGDDNNNNASDGSYSSPASEMTGASLNRGPRGTAGSTIAPGGGGGALPQQQQKPLLPNRHQHTTSLDRSLLLSPPAWTESSPGQPLESIQDEQDTTTTSYTTTSRPLSPPSTAAIATSNFKKHKQRPLSLGGLASLAQEHVMRKSTPKDHHPSDTAYTSSNSNSNNRTSSAATTATTSNSTPSSPSSATPGVTIGGGGNNNNGATSTKNRRLSQMASYLSQAAVNSNMTAHITNNTAQDATSEAVGWAWDFTKLKQTKDVLGLDFHYTTTTVFMTVVSKTTIDIYCRPRSTRGRKPPIPSGGGSGGGAGAGGGNNSSNGSRTSYSGADTPSRSSISSIGGGMAMAGATSPENPHFHRDYSQDPYEWKLYKQLYHPEAPSFMTVVKGPTEVTDIILGKGSRACVINVQDMSVTDLHRQETSSVIYGLSKKLGFRNSSLWHSFEKIPFDVPPHILFPAAAEAMYGSSERKETHSRPLSVYNGGTGSTSYPASGAGGSGVGSGGPQRQSRDNILQRPADQLSIHEQEMNEQERDEAARCLALKLQNVQSQGASASGNNNLGVPYPPTHHRGSSLSLSPPSSSSSSNSSSSIILPSQLPPPTTPTLAATATVTATATKTKTRMVTSDEVLNLAFSQRTTGQLFLATYGSQSRIVDLQGKPQSRIVLDWGESSPGSGSSSSAGCPPQKVEFLKTIHDIYVVGFEKSAIVVFSLTRAKKVKEITKRDLIQATARAQSSASAASVPGSNGQGRFMYDGSTQPHQYRSHSPQPPLPTAQTPASSPPSGPTNTSSSLAATALALTNATINSSGSSASIKFLGRDSMAEDSLGLFFSYCHPKNGVSICQLSVVPLLAPDELELIGYYP